MKNICVQCGCLTGAQPRPWPFFHLTATVRATIVAATWPCCQSPHAMCSHSASRRDEQQQQRERGRGEREKQRVKARSTFTISSSNVEGTSDCLHFKASRKEKQDSFPCNFWFRVTPFASCEHPSAPLSVSSHIEVEPKPQDVALLPSHLN